LASLAGVEQGAGMGELVSTDPQFNCELLQQTFHLKYVE
jgi:hypothetical protein